MKDFQHANRLYVKDGFARAPKVGFLYFVRFNINKHAIIDKTWNEKNINVVGLLAKKVDLPKFTIATETLNQYNRKTIVQKSISYGPINIDLHDDNSDITHSLWENYYKHYYVDGFQTAAAYGNTKYGNKDYNYGRYDSSYDQGVIASQTKSQVPENFFESIDIYVLHQKNFTKYTLVNPKIKDWKHDSVDQTLGNKVLQNSMSVEYESVFYKKGQLKKGGDDYMIEEYLDQTPSPHTIGNDGDEYRRSTTTFDNPLQAQTYGVINRPGEYSLLAQLGTTVLKNYINQNGLTRQTATAYNIAGSALTAALSSGPGKYGAAGPANNYAETPGTQPGVFNLFGGVKIDLFKGFNTSVDGTIRANPIALLFR
jgi:hypothetical protein